MNRNLGLCYTICWKFRASQINPFSYHYTLNKPLKNRKKVIINFRESRIENSHSNTKASLFYGNITIGIISGEWGSIIMLAGPTSPTYRGSTVLNCWTFSAEHEFSIEIISADTIGHGHFWVPSHN